ncbi:MAG: hypothetical protein GY714_02755 [Desulfobacterales bacterium]|nr:hypothetical protein [Desulfobacterales bacterium]
MKNILIFITMVFLVSCSSKVVNKPYISSVFKDFPSGKIKVVKKGGTMFSMTHKKFEQSNGITKHKLLDCLRIDLVYKNVTGKNILLESENYKCSNAKPIAKEKHIIILKKPCVFRFESLLIQVMSVNPSEIKYRILRDKG